MAKKRKAASPLQASPQSTNAERRQQTRTGRDIEELRQQLESLRQRVDLLELENDCLQRQARHSSLIFSGPAVLQLSRGEDTAELLREMILKLKEYQLNRAQVKSAFRIGARAILADFGTSEFG